MTVGYSQNWLKIIIPALMLALAAGPVLAQEGGAPSQPPAEKKADKNTGGATGGEKDKSGGKKKKKKDKKAAKKADKADGGATGGDKGKPADKGASGTDPKGAGKPADANAKPADKSGAVKTGDPKPGESKLPTPGGGSAPKVSLPGRPADPSNEKTGTGAPLVERVQPGRLTPPSEGAPSGDAAVKAAGAEPDTSKTPELPGDDPMKSEIKPEIKSGSGGSAPPVKKPVSGSRPQGPITTVDDPPLPSGGDAGGKSSTQSRPIPPADPEEPGVGEKAPVLKGENHAPQVGPDGETSARTPTAPGSRPGAARPDASRDRVDAADKSYGVISVQGTYEDLLIEFGRQSGLTPTGDIPKGNAYYAAPADKEMTWEEAFRRVKTAIWQADVLNRRTIVRDGEYLVVLSVNDYWRQMPEEHMFTSVAEFRAARPHDDELVYVQYELPAGSAANLDLLRSFVPDYARIAPVQEGSNVIGIYAKVSDINKYLTMAERFLIDIKDRREFQRIACLHILPSQAVETIERFMQKPSGKSAPRTPTPPARPTGGTNAPSRSGGDGLSIAVGDEPESIFIPNDERKEVQAYALPIRIEEFRGFLSDLDVEAEESKRVPVVIPVEHANADDLAQTIESILDAESGKAAEAAPPRPTPGRPSQTRSNTASSHGVVILPMTDWNQLVVVGSEEGVARVRELAAMFDQPTPGDATLHIAEIRHKTPSWITALLQTYDSSEGAASPRPTGGNPPRGGARPSAGKFTPDDENGRLYVLCSDREWEQYAALISQLDVDDGANSFTRIALSHLDPNEAIERINSFLGGAPTGPQRGNNASPSGSSRKLLATDGGLLVFGAGAAELQQIRDLVGVLDQPSDQIERTFTLQYADPQTIISIVEAMVLQASSGAMNLGGEGPPRSGRPTGRPGAQASAGATLFPLDKRLLVKASAVVMTKIEEVVHQFDVPPEEGTETRVYTYPTGTDVAAMAEQLGQVMPSLIGSESSGGQPSRGGRPPVSGGARTTGPQFIPQAATSKLIVIADRAHFPKIEEMIEHLKGAEASVRAMRHVALKKAQPEQIATAISAMIRNEQGGGGGPGPRPGRGGGGAPGGAGQFYIAEAPGGHAVVMHGTVAELDQAQKWIEDLDKQALVGQQVKLYHINEAEPKQLVDLIINVIDAPQASGAQPRGRAQAPAPQPKPSSKKSDEDSLDALFGPSSEPEWESTRTYQGRDLYLQADYYARTILIVTSAAKLEEIDSLLAKLDPAPGEGDSPLIKPLEPYTLIYELSYADAWDAYLALDTYVTGMWEDDPAISYDEDLNTLTVKHPRLSVLQEVQKIIFAVVDKPGEKDVPTRRVIPVPINVPVESVAERINIDGREMEKKLAPQANQDVLDDYGVEKVQPRRSGGANGAGAGSSASEPGKTGGGCVLPSPLSAARSASLILTALTQEAPPESGGKKNKKKKEAEPTEPAPKEKAAKKSDSRAEKKGDRKSREDDDGATESVEGAANAGEGGMTTEEPPTDVRSGDVPVVTGDDPLPGMPAPRPAASPPASIEPEGESRLFVVPRQTGVDRETGEGELEKVSLIWDPITNTLVVEGSYEDVTAVEEMVTELAKEQPSTKPDIRVYRVKYIDPVLAKDIIEEMFGAGSRNMQNLMRQQQQQMQQMAQRQAQQAAAARAAATGGGNRAGRGEEEDGGRQVPGIPGGAPGQPGRPGQPGQGDDGQQQNPNQQMLAQMQAQQSTQITVYANPRDRTLVFRAPTGMYPAILELLATIDRPQEVESEFRIFALKKLQAEDVEKKLRDFLRLDEKPKSQEERLRDAESDGGVMPKPIIDPISGTEIIPAQIRISSNPMANTIIALAPEPALNFIGTLITDWESFELPERKVEWVPLTNSLATDVSDMLDQHFADAARGGAGGDARGGKASGQSPIAPPTFLPYPRLNVVVVRATEEQMTEVKEVIARLDVAPEGTQYEFIELHCAEGGELATQLGQMFSDAGSGGKGRGGAPAEGAKFYATGDGRILFYSVPNAIKPEVLATIERIDQQTCMQQEVRIIDVKFGVPSEIADAVNLAYGGGTRGSSARGGGRGGSTAAGRITVTASDPTRKLFVSAPNEDAFKQVESLVGKLDIVTDLQFRVFKLQYLNARAVLEMMKGMMAQYQSGSGSRGSSEKFAVDADDATNALIVLGGPQTHAFIQMALTDLDTPDKAVGKIVTAMYQLIRANAEEVAKNINATYGDRKDKGVEVKAEANKAMNVVIVRASEKMQEEIKNNFINPLEEMQPPQLQYKVIDLKHVHPDLMADKIRALVSERVEGFKAVGAKGDAMSTTVVISSDPDMRQLLVLADEDNLKFIEERVTMLDTEETSLKEGLLTKKYPVQWADPNVLKSVIDEWTATRTGKGRTAKQTTVQTSARDLVLAFVDPATSSLIVTASENNHERIQQLLAELDVDTGLGAQREIVFLKQANAEELAQVLSQSMSKSGAVQKRQPGQQLTITPVPALNAILVSGAPKDIEESKALVAQLDLPPNEDAGIVIRVYPLEYLDPQYVVTMVNQAFAQTRSGKQRPEDTIKAAWTPPSNLIIGASKENHDKIAMLLTQLDVASSAQRSVQTIKLTYANAQDVAQNLSQLIQNTQAKKKTEVQPMYVAPDLGTNSLIVFANEVEMNWVKDLLTKLDVEEVTTGRTISSIKVQYADPQAVAQAISNVFGQGAQSSGGRKNPQDAVIAFPEMGTRSVIIASSPRMLKDVQALVAQLDKPEGADRPIRVVEIKNVDPEGVQQVLQDLFSGGADPFGGGRGRRGGGFFFWDQSDSGGGMVVALVPGTNNLVIRANDEEFKKITDLIAQIDVDLAQKQDIRVFMLKHIAVDEAQTALQSYLQRPGSSGSSNRNPFFFSPSRGGSSETLTGGARISAMTSANALVVVAEPEVMTTIEGVIAQLDSELYQEGTFEIIGVEQGYNVSLLAQQVSDAINRGIQGSGQGRSGGTSRGSVTITPDARTRSLIVTGAPSLFPQVRQMVEQLTSRGPAGGEETRLIPIKRLSADDVQAIIDMLRQQDEGVSGSSSSGRRR